MVKVKSHEDNKKFYAGILLINYIAAYIVNESTIASFRLYEIGFKGIIKLVESGEYTMTIRIISNPAVKGVQYFLSIMVGFPEMIGYVAMFFIAIIYLGMLLDTGSWVLHKI